MTCTHKPLGNNGASRASLLQKIGQGDIWDFLRDLLNQIVFRADIFDGEGREYLGTDGRLAVGGEVEDYEEYPGAPEAVTDIFQENPQIEEAVKEPSITYFVRTSNQYRLPTPGSGWASANTIKELVTKVVMNGEVYYGYTPLYSQEDNDAVAVPDSGELWSESVANFGQTSTALALIKGAWIDLVDKLGRQGVLRMIYRTWSGPG